MVLFMLSRSGTHLGLLKRSSLQDLDHALILVARTELILEGLLAGCI